MPKTVLVQVVFSNNPNGQEYTFLAPAELVKKMQIDQPVLIESARGVQTGLFRGLSGAGISKSDYVRKGITLKYVFDVVDMAKLADLYESQEDDDDMDFLL